MVRYHTPNYEKDNALKLGGVNKSLRRGMFSGVAMLARLLSMATVVGILMFLLPLALPYVEGATSFEYIKVVLKIVNDAETYVRLNIPTKVAGVDVTRWIIIFVLFIVGGSFGRVHRRFRDRAEYLRFKMSYDQMKSQTHLTDNARVFTPLKQKLDKMSTAKKKDREELLKLFAETKKKLDKMGRDLAFLAVDVVDSTGMKAGEERGTVEHDFKEYKRFVEGTFVSNGYLKAAWTPDGVMACFPKVDSAVKAARELLIGLDAFNKNVKAMKRDFVVRCGVNSGFVYYDETVPLEEVSDRVIDIAGHMQKHAPPGTVCIAKPSVEPLQERFGFEASGRVVDGYEVYEWKKNSA